MKTTIKRRKVKKERQTVEEKGIGTEGIKLEKEVDGGKRKHLPNISGTFVSAKMLENYNEDEEE